MKTVLDLFQEDKAPKKVKVVRIISMKYCFLYLTSVQGGHFEEEKELIDVPQDEHMIITVYLTFWLAVSGAVLGSFLDCAVSRWAAGQGLFGGRSRCAACGRVLSVFDLIPVFSWLFRRGRCKYCGAPIPADCLIAELAGAAGFVCLGLRFGPDLALGQWLIWWALLLCLSLTDGAKRLIPDPLLLALAANRIVWFFVLKEEISKVFEIFQACLVPAALLALVLLAERFLGREVMGGGDIKLLFALSLCLTWPQLLLTLLSACLVGLCCAALSGARRGAAVPFGPFLAAGALLTVCWGDPLIQWYFGLF